MSGYSGEYPYPHRGAYQGPDGRSYYSNTGVPSDSEPSAFAPGSHNPLPVDARRPYPAYYQRHAPSSDRLAKPGLTLPPWSGVPFGQYSQPYPRRSAASAGQSHSSLSHLPQPRRSPPNTARPTATPAQSPDPTATGRQKSSSTRSLARQPSGKSKVPNVEYPTETLASSESSQIFTYRSGVRRVGPHPTYTQSDMERVLFDKERHPSGFTDCEAHKEIRHGSGDPERSDNCTLHGTEGCSNTGRSCNTTKATDSCKTG